MPTPITHGSHSSYTNRGCRCDRCRDEHRLWCADRRRHRAAMLADNPTLAPHGTLSTYTNWGCRCQPCTTARKEAK